MERSRSPHKKTCQEEQPSQCQPENPVMAVTNCHDQNPPHDNSAAFPNTSPDVLVIGGTGLMGAPTARLLQERGHHVVIMSRGSAKGGHCPKQAECKTIKCDRENKADFHEALTSPDCPRVIVDFTAMTPEHVQDIISAHRQRRLDHYVFISTNMVYPGGVDNMDITCLPQPVAETAAEVAGADAAPDTYGGKKLKCEALLHHAATEASLPSTILRPPGVVGPGCDNRHERLQRLVMGLPPLEMKTSNRPPTVNPGLFRLAYCQDVADVVAAVVARGKQVHGETFNVANPESLTLKDYVAAVATRVGCEPVEVPDDPSFRNYERQGVLDVTKAQRLLGFQGTPVAQWMDETVAWHTQMLSETSAS